MLYCTLPPIYQTKILYDILKNEKIKNVRYNTGCTSDLTPFKTIEFLTRECIRFDKNLWVDLKGRQLRILEWAFPKYGDILLNHNVKVDLPATIYFRGSSEPSEIKSIVGNKIFVDPIPRYAVGKGQSVNIIGKNLKVDGFLTNEDLEFIKACKEFSCQNFMISFFEKYEDLQIIRDLYPESNLILKIESMEGLRLLTTISPKNLSDLKCNLMAARQDLFINSLNDINFFTLYLDFIIKKDPEAILATDLPLDVEPNNMANFMDIKFMKSLGYKNFLLGDEISHKAVITPNYIYPFNPEYKNE